MKKSPYNTKLNNKINLLLEKKLGVIYFYDWLTQHYGHQWPDFIHKSYIPIIKKWFENNQGKTPPENWEDLIPDDLEVYDEPTPEINKPGEIPFGIDVLIPGSLAPWFSGGSNSDAYPENYPGYPFGGTVNNDLPGGDANNGVR
jgi:hypothetical protein